MPFPKSLIINADDFGLCAAVNAGIIEAHEGGVVTSASLMVRQQGALEAGAYARRHARLSVGLHVDIAEWEFRGGEWVENYRFVDPQDEAAVKRELTEQLHLFEKLIGRTPTHLDSHQHAHQKPPLKELLIEAAHQMGIPLRNVDARVRHVGSWYGQTAEGEPIPGSLTVESLLALVDALPPGVHELGCHPSDHGPIPSVYAEERVVEKRVLTDPRLRLALAQRRITLDSYESALGEASASGS